MPVVERNAVRIYYDVHGSGHPLVLLPGLGSSGDAWDAVLPALAARHRVIRLDPRGSGRSGGFQSVDDGGTLAEDVAAVLDAIGDASAHVVGKSFGGLIAQEFAIRFPDRVRSLVLATTYARAGTWTRRAFEIRRLLIQRVGLVEQFSLSMMFVFSPRTFELMPDRVAKIEESFRANTSDLDSYLRQIEFCLVHDTRDRLNLITVPTLVIAASDDLLTPREDVRALSTGIPGAEYREVAGASHGLVWENPDGFTKMILEFVLQHSDQLALGDRES